MLDHVVGQLGVVEVEVGAAHDVDHLEVRADAPAALALAAAHDRHEPARAALAARDRHPRARAAGRVVAGDDDVGDQPLQLAVGARLVDGGQALLELVHRQPALAGGLAQDFGVAFAVGV